MREGSCLEQGVGVVAAGDAPLEAAADLAAQLGALQRRLVHLRTHKSGSATIAEDIQTAGKPLISRQTARALK